MFDYKVLAQFGHVVPWYRMGESGNSSDSGLGRFAGLCIEKAV